MRVTDLRLAPYGAFADWSVHFGPGLTLVLGVNEAGKSTALDGLSDLLWGIPSQSGRAFLHGRPALRLHGRIVPPDGMPADVTRRGDRLYDTATDTEVDVVWQGEDDSRDRWRRSFGLTHADLRAGGAALFRGEGDLAQLVFAARSGQGVRRLLEQLSGTADSLYKDNRNNTTALVRQANAEYGHRLRRVTAATAQAGEVETAALQLAEADRDLDTARRRAKAAADWLGTREARGRAAPNARALHEHRTRADRLRAAGAVLAGPDLATWAAATDRISTLDGELTPLRADLTELRDRLDAIDVDDTLLADGPEIRELHLACAAKLAERGRADEALRAAEALGRTAAELAAGLAGPHDTRPAADILAALHVPADLAAQLAELARQLDGVVARVDKAKEKFDSAVRERDEHAAGTAVVDATAVQEARDAIEADGSAVALWRDAVRRCADARQRRDEWLAKAGLPSGATPAGVLPSIADIDSAADVVQARSTEHRDAQRQLLRAERELANLRTELDATGAGAVPTGGQLRDARAARDLEITRLVRAWVSGTPAESAADLPSAVGRAVAHADAIADRMVESVEIVVRRNTLAAEVAKRAAEVDRLTATVTTSADELGAADERWAALWRDLGRTPDRTDALPFREQLTAARSAAAELAAMTQLAGDLAPQVEQQAATLSAALAQAGRARPGADLDSLLAAANQLLREADDAREAHALATEKERRVTAADKALRLATGRHDETLARWRAVASAAGLSEEIDPVGWRRRQEVVADATDAVRQAAARHTEGTAAQESYDRFVRRVTALACGHGIAVDDVAAAINELDARQATADARHRTAGQLAGQIDKVTGKIEAKESDRAAALAELDAIRTRLALPTTADLDEAAARGRKLAELRTEIDHLTDLVRTALPAADLAELVPELAAADPDELAAEIRAASTRHEEADGLLETARDRRAETDQRHRALVARTGAAQANADADAQAQLAEVEARVERYLVAHFQRTLLRSELAAYERRHASSLLDEAGRLLERLTGGRYVGLRVRHRGVGRSLTVVTADEVDRTPDELSEGTADEVFLALRLAGIAALQDERRAAGLPTLPVVLDDVLMAFDDDRSAATLRVLAELARDWQVIVLSHHEHLADVVTARDLSDVTVARLPPPEPLRARRAPDEVRASARASGGVEPLDGHRPAAKESDPDGASAREIRAWALREGMELAERGRIPAAVREAFYAQARGGVTPPPP